MIEDSLIIELLDKHHDRKAFSCGIAELDRYIREQAGQDIKKRTTSVFVALNDKKMVGFYSLSATSISHESLSENIARKLPKYPIPAVLLGRLAIDQSYQGKQMGKALMVNAMKRVLLASSTIGMYALIVDAKNENAKSFYNHFGFIEFINKPMRLFLPLDTIAKLI